MIIRKESDMTSANDNTYYVTTDWCFF